jgi:hypothetical protein
MTDEWLIGKDWEGGGHRLIEVLFRQLPGGTKEIHDKTHDGRYPGR